VGGSVKKKWLQAVTDAITAAKLGMDVTTYQVNGLVVGSWDDGRVHIALQGMNEQQQIQARVHCRRLAAMGKLTNSCQLPAPSFSFLPKSG
jgi:hypothetical protein